MGDRGNDGMLAGKQFINCFSLTLTEILGFGDASPFTPKGG